jgi:transcriptional regulator with XRE-family HTH domain
VLNLASTPRVDFFVKTAYNAGVINKTRFCNGSYREEITVKEADREATGLTFGKVIRQSRKDKGFSQRELAHRIDVDFTYLSKLENDRSEYAPKEEVIRSLAAHLDLDEEELIVLAGRMPQAYEEFLKQNYKTMPALLRRMRENPEFAQKVFEAASQGE